MPETYVIFICDFDPFGDGFYRYYTRAYCEETGKAIPEEEAGSFVKLVQRHIEKIKNSRAMEERYMLLEEMLRKEKQEGLQEGRQETLLESVFTVLEAKFTVPEELKNQMKTEKDLPTLKAWLSSAAKATTLEDFRAYM